MNAMIKQAVDHWHYIAPLLTKPENEDDFNTLVEALDELLDIVGDDETHPLMGLVHQLGDIVSEYENEHLPMPKGDGRAALAFLMQQHGLGQSDLPEVATQSVISEILNGKRQFNLRQIKALCERFNVSAETFLE
ncbi:helix-turn-helix domain-containing protein [Acinetobacter sp. ANC 4636]